MHSKPKRSRRVLEPQRLLHSERDIPGFFEQRSRQGLSGLNASWQAHRLAEAFRELRAAVGEQ